MVYGSTSAVGRQGVPWGNSSRRHETVRIGSHASPSSACPVEENTESVYRGSHRWARCADHIFSTAHPGVSLALVRAGAWALRLFACQLYGSRTRVHPKFDADADGADLDVTIILDCSGINGFELFDLLFGLVVILDWNRLYKRRTFIAYFTGLFAMFLGNVLRITSFVVLGNHGFAESITRVHIAAGWIFFSVVFLVYLCLTYGWMLNKKSARAEPQTVT